MPGIFSVKLKVSSLNGIDSIIKTNLIRYNDSVPVTSSCSPITFNQCCGYGISRFEFHTLDNSSTLGSYQNFTCTERVTVLQGRTYPLKVTTNPNQNQDTRVWIDYNSNGAFENSELVFEALNVKNPEANVLISNDTSVKKNKALRIRVVSEFAGGVVNPCSDLDKGQCEDYTVYVKENVLPPVAGFVVSTQDFCQPQFNFASTSTNVIAFYHWFFGDGTDTSTISPLVSHTFQTTGSYDVKLIVVGPFGKDSLTRLKAVSYYGAPITSCTLNTQAGGPQFGTGIAEVSFGTIFKRSGNSTDGYQNYSCTNQTTVLIGQKVPITIRNSGTQVEKVKTWIDWNRNGTFETTELVLDSQGDTVHTGLVTIPATGQTNATLRMRVASNFQNAGQINACGNIQLGQAEDYGIIVLANTVKPKAIFAADKSTTCTGIVQFTDSSENLPSTFLWEFGDGGTSTEMSPVHAYSTTGFFTVKLFASNEFGIDSMVKQNYIHVTQTTGMVQAVCLPPVNSTCCQYGIEKVVFAGIDQTSGGASEGHRDFTCATIGSAPIGTAQNITIVNSGTNNENVGVWIDWNNDGDFTSNESVFSSTGAISHGGTINIPGNAPAGLGLRMRVVSDFSNQPLTGPCAALEFGQAEDYQIILQGNNLPPIGLFSANELVTCSGSITFSDTSFNAPTTWKWYFGDGDSSSIRNPDHLYANPGTYTVKLIVGNANGADTITKINYVTVVDNKNLKAAPCTPQTINIINNQGVGILSVVFNSINRQSATAPAETYVDASCTNRTGLIIGQTYPISVLTNTNFPESCRAWIDWNNNGQFEDPSERILTGANSQSHSAVVTIPVTAVIDTALRMRVISDFGGGGPGANILPCGNPAFGQCEDYAVLVIANSAPPQVHLSSLSKTSCNGFIQFRDSSDFIPTSWLWNFGDGQTSIQKNPLHQYSALGSFTVKLKVTNAFGSDSVEIPNYVTISGLSGPKPATCTNTVASTTVNNGTSRVRFGTLDRVSGFGAQDGGYLDYTCTDSALVTVLTLNQMNSIIVNTSLGATRENCRVYIDFNNDGFFGNTESVLNSQNNNIHSANFVINQAQCLGLPVRMRVITENRFNAITTGCYNPQQGQAEDYRVRLVWGFVNLNPPIAKIYSPNPESCNGYVQFVDSSVNIPTSRIWYFGDGQTSTDQNPLHQYAAVGNYTVKLKVLNANGVDSVEILNYASVTGFSGPKPINCINNVLNPGLTNGTTRVRFGTLDKTSGLAAVDGGYIDYSCTDSANVTIVSIPQVTQITINTSSGTMRENCRVFIDFNNDGVFAVNEAVLNSQNNVVHVANLNLTAAQCLGLPVRMRVITDSRANPIISSCYNPQQGQVEDYFVRLVYTVSNETLISPGSINLYPNPSNGQFNIKTGNLKGSTFKVFGMTGKEVAQGKFSMDSEVQNIDLQNLSNGIYHLHIQTGSNSYIQKLIIQK